MFAIFGWCKRHVLHVQRSQLTVVSKSHPFNYARKLETLRLLRVAGAKKIYGWGQESWDYRKLQQIPIIVLALVIIFIYILLFFCPVSAWNRKPISLSKFSLEQLIYNHVILKQTSLIPRVATYMCAKESTCTLCLIMKK